MNTDVAAPVVGLLRDWLPGQRWYGAKGRPVGRVDLVAADRLLPTEGGEVLHALVQVDGGDSYQLLLGRHGGEDLPDRLAHARIGTAEGDSWYDAVHDEAAAQALLGRLVAGDDLATAHFASEAGGPVLDPDRRSRVMGAEQSNTSLVYDDAYILKLFRRLQPGVNPDLEVTRALAREGSPHVAAPLGWLEGTVDGTPTTLGMLQVFLRGASEGWAMATASVRDLFAEADLHADEVGGDFAGEAERLGAATAQVHRLMAQVLPSRVAGPAESKATAGQLRDRLDAAAEVVPELAENVPALRRAYDAVGELSAEVPVQRVHGDLHLGQVLRTQDGWVLLDFEGEPARPLTERTALMSPLRDVAGMLRSFDYAARHLLAEHPGQQHLAYRAAEWAERNRSAFCDGYAAGGGRDPREEVVLLRAFELDKAVYELVYEARNRPSWISIPLGSIERLAAEVPA